MLCLKSNANLLWLSGKPPLSIIHLDNMLKLAKAGATIMPANPGFYYQPESIQELVDFVVARILDHLGIEHELLPRWGEA